VFSIGEFARHGRVSVRMLRHYDAIGLLRPATVDAATGYRFYQAGQLGELNRIILAPVRVGELTGTAAGYEPEAITPVIQPLYCEVWQLMAGAGVSAAGPAIAYYEDTPGGDGAIVVHAAVPVVAEPGGEHRFRVVDLAEVDTAAAIIHHGSMDDVLATGQALARWIDASGYRSAGYAREVTLEWSEDPDQWVTELQQPIEL
jgi:effector-binding domain-containing protein